MQIELRQDYIIAKDSTGEQHACVGLVEARQDPTSLLLWLLLATILQQQQAGARQLEQALDEMRDPSKLAEQIKSIMRGAGGS